MSDSSKQDATSLVIGFGTFAKSRVAEDGPASEDGDATLASAEREAAGKRQEGPENAPGAPDDVGPMQEPEIDSRPRPALARPVPALRGLDVALCPAALLTKMSATTIKVNVDGETVAFTTSRIGFARAKSEGITVFVGGEFLALAKAVQAERIWPKDFRKIVAHKKRSPRWKLREAQAFGCFVNAGDLTWLVGEVFERIEAKLIDCEVH